MASPSEVSSFGRKVRSNEMTDTASKILKRHIVLIDDQSRIRFLLIRLPYCMPCRPGCGKRRGVPSDWEFAVLGLRLETEGS